MSNNLRAADQPVSIWLEYLRRLNPPAWIAHVGAGEGLDTEIYGQWGLERAVLIDAEAEHLPRLERLCKGRPGWTAISVLLADRAASAVFHVASNPDESGLLAPETLKLVWRNLKEVEARPMESQTLDSTLSSLSGIGWLVVGCAPALQVLMGGTACLDASDVVVVRVGVGSVWNQLEGVDEPAVTRWLMQRGFDRISLDEERNRAFGRALYVRRWREFAQTLRSDRDAVAEDLEKYRKSLASAQGELATTQASRLLAEEALRALEVHALRVEGERADQSKLAVESLERLECVENDRAELINRVQVQGQEIEALAAARHELEQTRASIQEQIAQLQADLHSRLGNEESLRQSLGHAEQTRQNLERDLVGVQAERDELRHLLQAAENTHSLQSGQLEQLVRDCDEHLRHVSELSTELERSVSDRRQLTQQLTQCESELHELDAQLQLALQQRTAEAELQAQLQTELAATRQHRDAAVHSATVHQAMVQERDQELSRQAELLAQRTQHLEQLQTERREQDEKARAAAVELAESRISLTLSLRSQSVAVGDLKDLQAQYASLIEKHERLLTLHQTIRNNLVHFIGAQADT